jgi:hypothetical protein
MFASDSKIPKEEDVLFSSLAKVAEKMFTYPPEGILALTRENRLVFISGKYLLYDWPVTAITEITLPWYQLGEGFRCKVNGGTHWVYFNKLSSTARTGMLLRTAGGVGDVLALAGAAKGLMDIASARGLCKNWKSVITAAQQSPAPAG